VGTALFTAAAFAAPAAHATVPLTGRVMVTLKQHAGTRAQAAAAGTLASAAGATITDRVPEIGLITLKPSPGRTVTEVVSSLRGRADVASVQREGRMTLRFVPNDPALTRPEPAAGSPPGTPLEWPAVTQNFFHLWDLTRGVGAKVAVIDVGADANHPDLYGKIDALVNQGGGPGGVDDNGHGTHVASLACGGTNNRVGIAGAGFDCHLIIERTSLDDSSIANSIVDAANRGADSINMSFGDDGGRPPVDGIVNAINFAYGKGAVLVAAASDDAVRDQGQPANILQPTGTGQDIAQGKGLSVTAATLRGEPSGAGLGSQISLAAAGSFATFGDSTGPPGLLGAFPGNATELERGSLFPPIPGCGCRTTLDGDNRYAYLQGTSMAAPQVAAVAALLKRLNPDLGPADVIRVLKQTAKRPTAAWTDQLGWGVMDAGAAADATILIDRRAPVAVVKGPTSTRGTSITLRLSASDPAPSPLVPSGVAAVEIYRSAGAKAYQRIARTVKASVSVRVSRNTRYRFFAVGIDKAGNRQATPASPQLRVRVR